MKSNTPPRKSDEFFHLSISLSLFFLLYIRLSGSTIISKSRRLTTTTEELISRGRGWPLRTRQPSGKSWTSLRVRRWPFMKTVDTSPGTSFFLRVFDLQCQKRTKITPCIRMINNVFEWDLTNIFFFSFCYSNTKIISTIEEDLFFKLQILGNFSMHFSNKIKPECVKNLEIQKQDLFLHSVLRYC